MTACIDHSGVNRYASCFYEGKYIGKHVRALILKTGEQANGRYALHTCANNRCIEPSHLYWGTQSDNMKDAYRDGNLIGRRDLNPHEVAEILATHVRYCRTHGSRALAKKFGVCQQTINRIAREGGYSPR